MTDTERLNWIEQHFERLSYDEYDGWFAMPVGENHCAGVALLRDALDAAIAKEKERHD